MALSTANSRWSTRKSSFTQVTIKCGFRDFGCLMIYKLETQKKESQHLQQFWFKKEHVFVVDLKPEASGKHRPLNMAQWHQNTSICFLATNSFPAKKYRLSLFDWKLGMRNIGSQSLRWNFEWNELWAGSWVSWFLSICRWFRYGNYGSITIPLPLAMYNHLHQIES
jgi:hypothetical protein